MKEAYYEETMETAGCPFVGSGHGGGNAAVLPDRYPAKYLVGDHGECGGNRCRDRIRIADMDRRQPDLDTHRRRHNDHQRHRGDEGL